MTAATACMLLVLAAPPTQEPAPAAAEGDGARHFIFLAENRPIFVSLRVMSGGRPFEASWINSIQAIFETLDKNGDGTLTVKEADPTVVAALVRLAAGAAEMPAFPELDVQPKDGKVSIEELALALRPMIGPFRLEVGRQGIGRTDALFDQLDRDKDEHLTRPELAAIAGSLRPLDLDDDEMISALEIEPYGGQAVAGTMDGSSERRTALTALSSVVELVLGDSTLRPARLMLKKYDKGKGDVPGRPDGKLSPAEFAIDPDTMAAADINGDDALDTDEVRKFLARPPADLTLEITLSSEAAGRLKTRVEAVAALPKAAQIRRLADGDVEFALAKVRLDIHVEDETTAATAARKNFQQQFKAADANKDGYLEGKELANFDAPQSPLAGLKGVIDRDGDGKIYMKELIAFGDRQIEAARARLVITTADHGRAIFGIVDLDGDRRLGAREVMRTVERVMSWDDDHDNRVSANEIPYHFQVTVARGGLAGLSGEGSVKPLPRSMSEAGTADNPAGTDWFQKMDRNHDGDVSRREFLGPRDQFDRLDTDDDGLIDAGEAFKAKSNPR